jgi:hypothetical protein
LVVTEPLSPVGAEAADEGAAGAGAGVSGIRERVGGTGVLGILEPSGGSVVREPVGVSVVRESAGAGGVPGIRDPSSVSGIREPPPDVARILSAARASVRAAPAGTRSRGRADGSCSGGSASAVRCWASNCAGRCTTTPVPPREEGR